MQPGAQLAEQCAARAQDDSATWIWSSSTGPARSACWTMLDTSWQTGDGTLLQRAAARSVGTPTTHAQPAR